MSDAGLHWAALAMAAIGMTALAMTISVHWRQLFQKRAPAPGERFALRCAGALALLASLWLCILADPVLMALLVWPMLLTVASGIVAALLTLHSQLTAARREKPRAHSAAQRAGKI